MSNPVGSIFLIPSPLNKKDDCLSQTQKEQIKHLNYFIVENAKPARNVLKKLQLNTALQDLNIFENNKINNIDRAKFLSNIKKGFDYGILSDCGLPCIADPGAEIVRLCHIHSIKIISLSNTCSITTSLMCSGLNGQNYEFIGYIPIEKKLRQEALKRYYENIIKTKKTIIIIESPHRNIQLFNEVLRSAPDKINFCVAYDISGPKQMIKTLTISDWKKEKIILEKEPCIFLIN
jgi:16S rRNA (cytidine1402-2'-O)-methyltransferase